MSNEYQYLDASTPDGEWTMIQERERGLEYGVDHFGDDFYIVTNKDAKNFKLVKAPVSNPIYRVSTSSNPEFETEIVR